MSDMQAGGDAEEEAGGEAERRGGEMTSAVTVLRRFVTVWIPDWPVIAARCDLSEPVAVLRANRVVARTPAAATEGVVIGQRRRQAQQRCPRLALLDDDPLRDAREFEPLVSAVAEISPRLEVVEPGWIALGARGPSRYFGGDEAVCVELLDRVRRLLSGSSTAHPVPGSECADPARVHHGVEAAVGAGVADGRFASGIAARLSVRRRQPVVVHPDGSREFCAPLPIGWLQSLGEIEPDLVDLFTRLGLRTLGDVAELGSHELLGRFGLSGLQAHRLAGGDDPRPPSTDDPAPERRLERLFDDPAQQREAVVFVAKQLADELARSLAGDGRVCTRLVVVFETEKGERSERSWYRSAGLSAAAMVDRVRWQLEGWANQPRGSSNEITSGIALVRLVPDEVRPDEGEQLGLWGGGSDADRRAIRSIARLTTLASESAVTVPVSVGGRLPAERFRWTPATHVDLDARRVPAVGPGMLPSLGPSASSGSNSSNSSSSSGADSGPWPGRLPSPSPAAVFEAERPVDVVDAHGQPVRVSGRGMVSAPPARVRVPAGGERRVTAWAGPWPVDQRWWDPTRHRRLARFQMVLADDRGDESAWLVVAERRRWWLAANY